MVEIGNQGSKDLGYDGLSDLWFSKYDMPANDFLMRPIEYGRRLNLYMMHFIVMLELN
jgi:hypothetical protein